jgi:hypothetical protein
MATEKQENPVENNMSLPIRDLRLKRQKLPTRSELDRASLHSKMIF